MKWCLFVSLLVIIITISTGLAIPSYINYQGYLSRTDGSALDTTVAMTFKLYSSPSGGTLMWTENRAGVSVQGGLFNVRLGDVTPLTDDLLNHAQVWLGTTVGNNSEMTPRVQITSVAYSYRVGTVDGASGGNISGKLNVGTGNSNSGSYANVFGENNAAGGTDASVTGGSSNSASGISSFIGGGYNNNAINNDAAIAGGLFNVAGYRSFVGGGESDSALDVHSVVAGGYGNVARAERSAVGGGYINFANGLFSTVAGGALNVAGGNGSAIVGGNRNFAHGFCAFVGGGGGETYADSNSAFGDYSMVGGGRRNRASAGYAVVTGGYSNTASGTSNTVSGGSHNVASGTNFGTVSGGQYNEASGWSSTIGGGSYNVASGGSATVGGGYQNTASGGSSVVPGGYGNIAGGNYSFAAGQNAHVSGNGVFAWADATGDTFGIGASNTFNARASAGFRFWTTSDITQNIGARLPANSSAWTTLSDSTQKTDIRRVDTKSVLDKIALLPISEWRYKAQPDPSIRHIGPMAQDFWNAFHLGEDSLGISTIDPPGVALAAIQELAKENKELRDQLSELREQFQSHLATEQQTTNKEN